jgi:hypothetical protein
MLSYLTTNGKFIRGSGSEGRRIDLEPGGLTKKAAPAGGGFGAIIASDTA